MVQVLHRNRSGVRVTRLVVLCVIGVFVFVLIRNFEGRFHLIGCSDDPIDVVYTWVNGSDPKFVDELGTYQFLNIYLNASLMKEDMIDYSIKRYSSKNELLYSLRSLEQNAPWVRHVYIVTNGQVPTWLNIDNGKVTVVTHKQIYPHSLQLPTFSSPAIETHLHKIPGLSKRFIYVNDDTFFRSPVYKDDFVSQSGAYSIYLTWTVPMCYEGCSWSKVADRHCDEVCNNPSCQMDGGDCGDTGSEGLLVDVKVKFEDYVGLHFENKRIQFTNYSRILAHLKNTTGIKLAVDEKGNSSGEKLVQRLIDDYNTRVMHMDKLKKKKYSADTYSASLQYTNRLLNRKYGFSVRKVPAHVPIMIDRGIMEELQRKFEKEVRITSSNRVRTTHDLQYSFSYYYFLMHEKVHKTIGEIFDLFDTDHSHSWSQGEARLALTKINKLPLSDNALKTFEELLVRCFGRKELDPLPRNFNTSKELLTTCPTLSRRFLEEFGIQHKYDFTLVQDSEKTHVAFKMLTSNISDVTVKFDEIRKTKKKFVCINDDLDYDSPTENAKVLQALHDLYESLFPNPGAFELERGHTNEHQYLHELKRHGWPHHEIFYGAALLALFAIVVMSMRLNGCLRSACTYLGRFFARRSLRRGSSSSCNHQSVA